MALVGSKPPQDDASLVMVLLDTNPFFWGAVPNETPGSGRSNPLTFTQFLQHVLAFLNSILLLNQMNQLVVIATGLNSCECIFDSSAGNDVIEKKKNIKGGHSFAPPSTIIVQKVEAFIKKDHDLTKNKSAANNMHSLISGSLSLALCYIQRILRSAVSHPQPRILCLQGSPDGPQQYVAVMNAIFSAQRSMVPIDSCIVGSQHSAFLQQASHITGGIYLKPSQPEGLFQFLAMVFATDLHSRQFLLLPRPTGVDFRASCFCHKKTIDMGYVCSVCLSIFCKRCQKCSTCESAFKQNPTSI